MCVLKGLRSDPEMFHLIGFGVGAHIAGIAGSWLNGTVGRITGLDPFAPEFSAPNSSVYLDRADGQYVEIIHTNFNPTEPVPALGFSSPLGHIDYYVGLGFELPGCPSGLIKREDYLLCSHRRAHQIYTSSIRAPCRHFAFPCPSLDNFQHTLCTLCYQPGLTTCPEMGYNLTWLPTTRPPLFSPTTVFLTVAPSPPYCVTPLLLKLKMGGISSMEAKLYIQLEGNTNKTSTMLVSGKEIREFAANKNYEFLISSDSAGDFHTITLEFNTQRLLHLDWRKRTISIDHLLLSHLPLYKRKFYEAWNIAVVENRRVKVLLEEILV
uniref:Phospholipase A1 member A n=1 Tax=Astyanax mexicanus TaxID=7994 RepID=A0A3B1JQM8_ASTMX